MTHAIRSRCSSLAIAMLALAFVACSDALSAPSVVTMSLRLQGASPSHGGIMIDVRGLPERADFIAASGATLLVRRTADQRGWSVLVAGDLTRSPLVTITSSGADGAVRGTVLELADQRGQLLTTGLPSVVIGVR